MARVLVLALALGLLVPSALAAPTTNDRFQGHGTTWDEFCFEHYVVMEQVGSAWYATLFSACSLFLPFTATGIVFRMRGSWEEGWKGTPLVYQYSAALDLGPYGDGTAISFAACLMCTVDKFYFHGTLRDLHLA